MRKVFLFVFSRLPLPPCKHKLIYTLWLVMWSKDKSLVERSHNTPSCFSLAQLPNIKVCMWQKLWHSACLPRTECVRRTMRVQLFPPGLRNHSTMSAPTTSCEVTAFLWTFSRSVIKFVQTLTRFRIPYSLDIIGVQYSITAYHSVATLRFIIMYDHLVYFACLPILCCIYMALAFQKCNVVAGKNFYLSADSL